MITPDASDTPRTDVEAHFYSENLSDWSVRRSFAKTFERELNAANAEIERLTKMETTIIDCVSEIDQKPGYMTLSVLLEYFIKLKKSLDERKNEPI